MHQDRLLPMNRARKAAWCMALVLAAVLGSRVAWGGEVTVVGSVWQSPPVPELDGVMPPPQAPIPSPPASPEKPPLLLFPDPPEESSWYTQVDYFRWSEPRDGNDETTECGTLSTLGYVRRLGSERFRAELFGGNMLRSDSIWVTYTNFLDGSTRTVLERENGIASHFGGRGEYEYLWNVGMEGCPPVTLFAGIGTRIWNDSFFNRVTVVGDEFDSYSQAWWTIYPYVGVERKRGFPNGSEVFASGRIGATAVTFTRRGLPDRPAYYPAPGITGQLECGLRYKYFFLSANFEAMTWQTSSGEHIHNDPAKQLYVWSTTYMYTTGLKFGLTY